MPIDTYTIYTAWCLSTGRTPPAREWWDKACASRNPSAAISDIQFDTDTERREGWVD